MTLQMVAERMLVMGRVAYHLVSDDIDIVHVGFLNQFSSVSCIVLFLGIYSPFIVSLFKTVFFRSVTKSPA